MSGKHIIALIYETSSLSVFTFAASLHGGYYNGSPGGDAGGGELRVEPGRRVV